MRLFGLVPESVVDGPGVRTAIFVQGCSHNCPGCHNPESHDPNGGTDWPIRAIISIFCDNPLLSGITLTGGEPFDNPLPLSLIADAAHEKGLTVWAYTGYTVEELMQTEKIDQKLLLRKVDVLVDGPFILEQRTLDLPWRGSKNQRLIDMTATRESGTITLYRDEGACTNVPTRKV